MVHTSGQTAAATAGSAVAQLEPGMVVEAVAKNSEAEKAGVREGDVILGWERGDSRGLIGSPFDLSFIEIEQTPQGSVNLDGLRGAEKQVWVMGPAEWGLTARPNFSEDFLDLYREAQDATTKKAGEAAKRWRELPKQSPASGTPWVRAWLLFHGAELLKNAQQWKDADPFYQSAVAAASEAGPVVQSQILQAWARAYQQRNDWTDAEKYFRLSIAKAERSDGGQLVIAANMNALGRISDLRGALAAAEQFYRQALAIEQKLSAENLALATTFNGLGNVADDRGDLDKAEQYHRQALEIRERLAPGSLDVAASLNNLGNVADDRGDLAKAEQYHRQALEIRERLAPGSLDVAASLNNLGNVADDRGELAKADKYLRQALEIEEKLTPHRLELARSLTNLGAVAYDRGELAKADQYVRQALEIEEKLAPGGLEMALSFSGLGNLASERGDSAKAVQYLEQALGIHEKLNPGSLYVATSLEILGTVVERRGDLAKAVQYLRQALAIRQKLAPESLTVAESIESLGDVSRKSRELSEAEGYYRSALAIREKLAPGTMEHAESLAAVASVLRDQQQLDAAGNFYERAVSALEKQIARLGGSEEVRSGFRAQHSDTYKDYLDLVLAQKRSDLGLEILERSRARILLEMLVTAHVDIRKGAEPSLLQQERSLQELIAAKSDRRLRLLAEDSGDKQAAVFSKEIEDLEKQYQEVEEHLRLNSPAYAALTQSQPLHASDIQQLLDPDTLLLEYSLGEERSYVFMVTPASVKVYELPKRAEVEKAASAVYSVLTARNTAVRGETRAQRRARWAKEAANYSRALEKLSHMILAPVAQEIEGKRLLIVSDGALQYIPFAALPSPESNSGRREALIVQHEIINLPSASVLAVLRQAAATHTTASKAVIVLADPVFDAHDGRVRGVSTAAKVGADASDVPDRYSLNRSAREVAASRNGLFPRLLFSRREAQAIYATAPPGEAAEALDFDASKATAMSARLSEYRIVHLATHGLLNSEHPELSGLVFSLVDRQGHAQDGFLRLLDIYNLELNADLVVLSACQTALGKQVDGEGLIGLARGFMYAGASRVLASLWKVDDEATAALMQKFYEGILKDGQSPAKALRAAQIWMRGQKRWKSPYFWAGFVLLGEAK